MKNMQENIDVSLLPLDVGFNLKVLGMNVNLPIDKKKITVKFLNHRNQETTKTASPFVIRKILRACGYRA